MPRKRVRVPVKYLKDHPIFGTRRVEIHHIIACERLGRKLFADEVVHHDDRNRRNNSPENLIVMSKKDHDELHKLDRARGSSLAFTGVPLKEETKRKISLKLMGNKSRTGQKHPPEILARMKEISSRRARDTKGRLLPGRVL